MLRFSNLRSSLFWLLCLGVAAASWRFIPLGVEAAMEFVAYHAVARPLAFYAHVGLAPVALALLPFQYSKLRARRQGLHRWIGRVYGLAILLSGTAALVLALGTEAGAVAATGFAALAVLWLTTTGVGIWHARAGNITAHRRWMVRSAALTFAAVTLRLELPLLIIAGMDFDAAYSTVAWLCWVPNVLLAEWLLKDGSPPIGARAPGTASTQTGSPPGE